LGSGEVGLAFGARGLGIFMGDRGGLIRFGGEETATRGLGQELTRLSNETP
jgi:hypothetical protein